MDTHVLMYIDEAFLRTLLDLVSPSTEQQPIASIPTYAGMKGAVEGGGCWNSKIPDW